MRICYVGGAGRLGWPMAVWSAHRGFEVVVADTDERAVTAIEAGMYSVPEPGVDELGGVRATTDVTEAARWADIVFVLVQSPSLPDGSFDSGFVEAACVDVGLGIADRDDYPVVAIASTVMPGSVEDVIRQRLEEASGKVAHRDFGLCYTPESVRQGCILQDFSRPDFVIIGHETEKELDILGGYFFDVTTNSALLCPMSIASAEIAKLALNTYITTKLAKVNEIAMLCHATPGASAKDVLQAIGNDSRISPKFFSPGPPPGGPCLLPQTMVQTEHGLEEISQIKVGDLVFSHDGSLHPVTAVFVREYDGSLIELTLEGFPDHQLVATPDHPVWASRRISVSGERYKTVSTTGKRRLNSALHYEDLDFISCGKVLAGDLLVLPRLCATSYQPQPITLEYEICGDVLTTTTLELTPNIMRLIGWYVADGSSWKKVIQIDLHKDQKEYIEDVVNLARDCCGRKARVYPHGKNGVRVRFCFTALARYFRTVLGHTAKTKRVPPEWLFLPDEQLINLLRGMWYGDGSSSGNRYTWATVSYELFNFMKMALLRLGVAFTTKAYQPRIDKDGVSHQKSYFLTVANSPAVERMTEILPGLPKCTVTGKRSVWFENDYMLFHVRGVKSVEYHGPVCNLEVEGTNSYMLESSVVHNCFPRDGDAMRAALHKADVDSYLSDGAREAEEMQLHWIKWEVRRLRCIVGSDEVGLLGLTYKPNVSLRDGSLSIELITLFGGFSSVVVRAYDPAIVVGPSVRTLEELVEASDVLVLMTCWEEFKRLADFDLAGKAVLDMWGFYDEDALNCDVYVEFGEGR